MNFLEAYEQMRNGKIVHRNSTPSTWFRKYACHIQYLCPSDGFIEWYSATMYSYYFDAEDWEVVE